MSASAIPPGLSGPERDITCPVCRSQKSTRKSNLRRSRIMTEVSINLSQLTGNQSDKLSGIQSWDDLKIVGKSNLKRIVQLSQENIYRMMSEIADAQEMKQIRTGIDLITKELIPKSINKPTLPKLRNEVFRQSDLVCAYLGDTTKILVEKGWLRGKVVSVSKAFNKDWKDGKPNSGYFWKVAVEFDRDVLLNENKIVFSTTEPRVIFDWEYNYFKNSGDGEFFANLLG